MDRPLLDNADDARGGEVALEAPRWRPPVERSRLSVYAAIGATAGAVPLPWIPDALARRVRGALVRDVAARHGIVLSRDAREVLANPSSPGAPRSLVSSALRFVGAKVALRTLTGFGPVGALWPARAGLRTYVLGHLFDRYLEISRVERGARIDADEARRVRRAIDGAIVRALTVMADPVPSSTTADDERDAATAIVDGLLDTAAGVPERLVRRVDAAFDDLLVHENG